MAIVVTCGQCQASFGAKDADAGKRGRCPKCRGEIVVPVGDAPAAALPLTVVASRAAPSATATRTAEPPVRQTASPPLTPVRPAPRPSGVVRQIAAPTLAAPAAQPADLARGILESFQGSIERVPLRLGYRLGVLFILLFMLLLPVCYVVLIGLVCALLGWHAVHDTALLQVRGGGRIWLLALVVYLAPLVAGGILVLFMIKPLFARPAKRSKPRSLDRNQESFLFAFVDRVCLAVGAPRPKRIDVDCDVNASASFRRGAWSMLGNDLVLTIGLPLVAGLNLRQFAGVLAHEFGHFSQGAGMRLSYLVRSVSWWLTRSVYERDQWDEWLIAAARESDIRIGIIFYLSLGFVWCTRKVLWVLMMLGHVISGFMLRQMEFDADCYEARLAGSDAFEATMRRLKVLGVATQGAYADLGEFYREGRLGDDLPRLIVANIGQITDQGRKLIEQQADEEKAGWFSTHPADCDRIAQARAEAAPGIFRVEQPATLLFRDFAALSKTCTFDFYRQIFGKSFKLTDMHPTERLLARQEKTQDDVKSLSRYFQGEFNVLRPLHLPKAMPAAPARPTAVLAQLKQARQSMLDAVPSHAQTFAVYDQADTNWLESEMADALFNARIRPKSAEFKQAITSPQQVLQTRQTARRQIEQLGPQLEPLEKLAVERLEAALQLIQVDKVAQRVNDAATLLATAPRMVAAAAAAGAQVNTWLGVRNRMAVLSTLFSRTESQKDNAALLGSIEKNLSLLARQVRDLQFELSHVRYPFDHAKADPTLAEFLLPDRFNERDWPAVLGAAQQVMEGFPRLYARLLGWLTALAEQVEAAVGLPPLPAPPEKEAEAQPSVSCQPAS